MKNKKRIVREILRYVEQFRGKVIILMISDDVKNDDEKVSNVIRDIWELTNSGVKFVVFHSSKEINKDPWSVLPAAQFISEADVMHVPGYLNKGKTPIISFNKDDINDNGKVMTDLASEVGAIKLFFIVKQGGFFRSGKLVSELTAEQAKKMSKKTSGWMKKVIVFAANTCQSKIISRVHIIGPFESSLMQEILTCDGVGTMVYLNRFQYKHIRKAEEIDVLEIFEVINDAVGYIDFSFIKENIEHFSVFVIDDQVNGCIMTKKHPDGVTELAYIGTSSGYDKSDILLCLVEDALKRVPETEKIVFIVPSKSTNLLGVYPWVDKLGFSRESKDKFKIPGELHETVLVKKI